MVSNKIFFFIIKMLFSLASCILTTVQVPGTTVLSTTGTIMYELKGRTIVGESLRTLVATVVFKVTPMFYFFQKNWKAILIFFINTLFLIINCTLSISID